MKKKYIRNLALDTTKMEEIDQEIYDLLSLLTCNTI